MRDTHDHRFPIIEWACGILDDRLEGGKTLRSRPNLTQLSPAESGAAVLIEQALQALPSMFFYDPDNYSGREPTPAEQSAIAASLHEVSRFASEAGICCAEAKWVDFGRIADLLTNLPAIIGAQSVASEMGRGLFWNWHEEAEEALHERERAFPQQDGGPAELTSTLQRILELSRLLELQMVMSRLERALLPLCKRAMVLAARQGKWEDVASYRGQYMSCWHNVQARRTSPRNGERRSSTPRHLWSAMGASLATIHSQTPVSSFHEPKPSRIGSKRKEQSKFSEFSTFPSIAALRLDMSIAFRGTSPEEWDDFLEGYLKYAKCSPDVKAELGKLNRPDAEVWTDEYHGVDDPPPLPQFAVRLCTHALRNGGAAKCGFIGRLEAVRRAEGPERRCRLAARLIIESADIDANVTNEATGYFYDGIQAL